MRLRKAAVSFSIKLASLAASGGAEIKRCVLGYNDFSLKAQMNRGTGRVLLS
jgi:hypothetical protein